MKKVLILAFDFPPYVSVGGLRPYSWYKYFKEFGLYPVVITRQWGNKYGNELDYISAGESKEIITEETENGIIIRSPYSPNLANRVLLKYGNSKFRLFRKIISAYFELTQYFFLTGPKKQLFLAAKKYLNENSVDLILATGEPFVLFKYASTLSKIYSIPWIADYRDPWTQDKSRGNNLFRVKLDSFLERRIVSGSIYISTVSEFFMNQIKSNVANKKFVICPNGYDSENIDIVKEVAQNNDVFTISFVGTLYKWHPFESFISVVSKYVESNPDKKLIIKLYGTNLSKTDLFEIQSKFPLAYDKIVIVPRLENSGLIKALAKDNVMLLFNYYSYMGTKIYDYLGLKRKILFCYSEDKEAAELKSKYFNINESDSTNNHLQEDLIIKTNSGIIVKDSNHLLTILDELYKEFEIKGYIECNSFGIEDYSRREQAGKLADVINEVCRGSAGQ